MSANSSTTLRAIRYEHGKLEILDQLLLPSRSEYVTIQGVEQGWKAIHSMQLRRRRSATAAKRPLEKKFLKGDSLRNFGVTGIACWNPAFDVTPADLITGIITEVGVHSPADIISLKPQSPVNHVQQEFAS
ncbi:hypothetical protein B566_EDAN010938 [Ephemera danica]|nr:hypothetical protein B566_EDAN010938 [Ephemera danica]